MANLFRKMFQTDTSLFFCWEISLLNDFKIHFKYLGLPICKSTGHPRQLELDLSSQAIFSSEFFGKCLFKEFFIFYANEIWSPIKEIYIILTSKSRKIYINFSLPSYSLSLFFSLSLPPSLPLSYTHTHTFFMETTLE